MHATFGHASSFLARGSSVLYGSLDNLEAPDLILVDGSDIHMADPKNFWRLYFRNNLVSCEMMEAFFVPHFVAGRPVNFF